MAGRAGIYARVSVKHYNDKDMTIENQILVASRYIKENGMVCKRIYTDAGFSGMDFKRPGWNKLVSDIEGGELDAVIVKDLSRIGRNYIETGEYIEKFFPAHGVRLVTVTELYNNGDSLDNGINTGLKNIVNEWYAREAGRKVSVVKQYQKANGCYTGGVPPYGYCAVYKDGKRMLKKAGTMDIVNKIKGLRDKGFTSVEIAGWLNDNKVNTPSVYNATGEIYCTSLDFKRWDAGSVRRLW